MIPLITSESGLCLTGANWHDAGVTIVACHLSALLMKPGFELLNNAGDLASYIGMDGDIALNASMLKVDAKGGFTLRSTYDGARTHYTIHQIILLIKQLNPSLVILPEGMRQFDHALWETLPDTMQVFLSSSDCPKQSMTRSFGVYFDYDASTPVAQLLEQIEQYSELPCYVAGDLDESLIQRLTLLGVLYLESDIPARDACQGVIYHHEGKIAITDHEQALRFDLIDESCLCSTCKQGFSRAYMHHLLAHTPLLCQRFLVTHNVHYLERLVKE